MSDALHQKSLKSRVSDELNALRKQEIAKNRKAKFKDEGSTFLTPEQAQTYLAKLRLKKKSIAQPTPPRNLPSAELNDWYSQQRKMQLVEQKKRVEAEKFLRGYRSKLDYGSATSHSPRRKKNDNNAHIPVESVDKDSIDNVMLEIQKLEREVGTISMEGDDDDQEEEASLTHVDDHQSVDVTENEEYNDNDVEKTPPSLNGDDGTEGNPDISEANVNDDAVGTGIELVNSTETEQPEPEKEENAIPAESEIIEEQGETATEVGATDETDETNNLKEAENENEEKEPEEVVVDKEEIAVEDKIISENALVVEEEEVSDVVVDRAIERHDSFVAVTSDSKGDTTTSDDKEWRDMISSEPGAKFPPEANRYHLYVSHACPWAHRTVLVVALKGLENVIGMTYVHPTWQYTKPGEDEHRGWVFGSNDGQYLTSTSGSGSFPTSWGEEDPIMGAKAIRDIYERVNDSTGRYILPVLWDKKLNTIVSNESSEIIRMLNLEFNEYASNPDLDLYPVTLAEKIDEINHWIYPSFNNGVYRCGLASTQECYDVAIDELTEAFDKIDLILQNQRFIAGDKLTEADVRLFVTLIRFDEVYDIYFKTNTRSVSKSPAVLNYVREIYQMDNVAKTVDMDMIKAHYYTSHVELNKYSIIPRGVNFVGLLNEPHNRES